MIVYDQITNRSQIARFFIFHLISSIALESPAHCMTALIPSQTIATIMIVPIKLVAASVTSWRRSVGLGFGSDFLMPSVLLIFREQVLLMSWLPLQLMPRVHFVLTIHFPSFVSQFGHIQLLVFVSQTHLVCCAYTVGTEINSCIFMI